MSGTEYIVYAARQSSNQIVVLLKGSGSGGGGKTPHFLTLPFEASGIAVDQDYVWVFSEKEFGFCTHARAVRHLNRPVQGPSFIRSTKLPSGQKIDSLYPCDDGTLVISTKDGPVYSGAYRVNLKASAITAYDGKSDIAWTKIRDRKTEGGLEKLPVYCWPQFESLTETLEKFQKAFSAQGAHA